jgi:hypothetical protein
MGCYIAIQPNGEQHQIEYWAVKAWANGTLTDPLILASLVNVVELREPGFYTYRNL